MCGSTRIEPGAAVRVRVPGPWTWFGCLSVCNCLFVCLFVYVANCEWPVVHVHVTCQNCSTFSVHSFPVTSFCVSSLRGDTIEDTNWRSCTRDCIDILSLVNASLSTN